MSLTKFKANNHPQQVGKVGAKDEIDDRATPPEDFGPLDVRFGFTLDVAAAEHNAKCARYYDKAADGLTQSWAGERVWCNPPYSNIRPWVEKAARSGAELVVMLLPANRTEQAWWQDLIEPDRRAGLIAVEFMRGRMRFIRAGKTEVGPNERPPFGNCLAIWADYQA
jgi:phage N-6-adenine-methyltransferase